MCRAVREHLRLRGIGGDIRGIAPACAPPCGKYSAAPHLSRHQLAVRQMVEHFLHRAVFRQRRHHDGQRLRPDLRQRAFARLVGGVGQRLQRRRAVRMQAGLFAARVHAIPAIPPEVGRHHAVQIILRRLGGRGKPLVAQPGGDGVRAQQRGQQMRLGEAIARAVFQHLRRLARHGIAAMVPAVQDRVAHVVEAIAQRLHLRAAALGERHRLGGNQRVFPVDIRAAGEIGCEVGHGACRVCACRADYDATFSRRRARGAAKKQPARPAVRMRAESLRFRLLPVYLLPACLLPACLLPVCLLPVYARAGSAHPVRFALAVHLDALLGGHVHHESDMLGRKRLHLHMGSRGVGRRADHGHVQAA